MTIIRRGNVNVRLCVAVAVLTIFFLVRHASKLSFVATTTPCHWEIKSLSMSTPYVDQAPTDKHRICHVPDDQVYGYVCTGPEYNAFADKLEAFLSVHDDEHHIMWGKRTFPFPNNSTILAVGNSLTRQVFQQLPCQYHDQVVSWVDRESNQTNVMRRGTFYHGTFTNGAQVFVVTNHAMFYSPYWPKYLKELIGQDNWNAVDLMVVGHINHFMQAYNTSFMELMMEQTKKWEGANFATISPPNLTDFAQVYDGPIVAVSMMADWSWWDQDFYEMDQQRQKMQHRRNNVQIVHGRKYISQLGECGSNGWWYVGNCTEAPDMHRCIGARGGHPDLVAFDTVEAVYQALANTL